ncbi:sensor histidine kinase, PAS and PAS domain-containing [Citrifermentans bemidjiense Bem]|uniref:histidine kinase n=1 Tax=Citrifermentans bemidjiense (strain ATCC BAA-1014 / DSM 16622 / JCM 12645 / Bem) TaxID=404380 RepID=B5EGR2_CITBB|nr:PAS domain-containing protein [Citrifermentans bemidjiense]ACH39545.1 sensor histidine kinase, PAS and PAS domain-containing [Citrifermentans bemidjiense Bem]
MEKLTITSRLLRMVTSALLVFLATVVGVKLLQPLGLRHPLLIYYPAVAVSAIYLGLEGGLTATLLSALSAAYFSIEPRSNFAIRDFEEQLYVAVFVLEGCIISYAAYKMRRAETAEAQIKIAKERTLAAERLEESEIRLRLALEGAKMGMWTLDVTSNQCELSDQEYDLLGDTKGGGLEPVDAFFERVHPDDREEFKRLLSEVLDHGDNFSHEFRIVRPDGEIRWLAARARLSRSRKGKPIRMHGVNYDVTSQRRFEEQLRHSENEARARANELAVLMDTVPAITFIAHDPECRDMSGSRKSREMLRVPEGKSVSASAPEGEFANSFHGFKDGRELSPEELPVQMAARGQEVHDYELTLVFNDGTSCEVIGNAVPLFDGAGKARGAIGAFLDITEQKRIQRELEKVRDELDKRVKERTAELRQALETLQRETEERIESVNLLIHQSRLAAMGEMIGYIAHQWRQPLNIMGLIVQEMPMVYGGGEFTEEYLKAQMDKARQLVMHMSATIDDFRDFFKPSKEKEVFKAGEMIRKTLALIEGVLKTQQITVHADQSGDPDIYGYIGECCQVLLSLLVNSRDAFLAREEIANRAITIRTFSEDGKTVLTISDNAGGIPEEIRDKIFDAYFTTKPPEKGTGLGLSLARKIIEKRMNGRFTFRDIVDGAEFRIEIDSKPAA